MTRVVRHQGLTESQPPTLAVRCPTCRRFLPAPAERVGMVRACPLCGQLLWIGWWDWYGRAFSNLPVPPQVGLPSEFDQHLPRRVAAACLDLMVWGTGVLAMWLLPWEVFPGEAPVRYAMVLCVSWAVVPTLAWWCGGRSPGKWLTGLQVVNANFGWVELWRHWLRDLAKISFVPFLVTIFLFVGGLARLFWGPSPLRLVSLVTIHDRILATAVCRDP